VLKRTREPEAERVGMHVFTEEDLEKAKHFFDKAGPAGEMGRGAASGAQPACLRHQRRADRAQRHHCTTLLDAIACNHQPRRASSRGDGNSSAGTAAARQLAARAAQSQKIYRIGTLETTPLPMNAAQFNALRDVSEASDIVLGLSGQLRYLWHEGAQHSAPPFYPLDTRKRRSSGYIGSSGRHG
jgi:hypothetical protein